MIGGVTSFFFKTSNHFFRRQPPQDTFQILQRPTHLHLPALVLRPSEAYLRYTCYQDTHYPHTLPYHTTVPYLSYAFTDSLSYCWSCARRIRGNRLGRRNCDVGHHLDTCTRRRQQQRQHNNNGVPPPQQDARNHDNIIDNNSESFPFL